MATFRNLPIKEKLVIVTMVTTTSALLLAGVGVIAADAILFRGYLERDLSALSRIIADNSTAALAFDDAKSAAETLAALRERTHVEGACVYRLNGSVLATYSRQDTLACPAFEAKERIRFSSRQVTVVQPIVLNRQQIGTLMLLYDLREIDDRAKLFGSAVGAVFLASCLLAFVLSSRLRRVIVTPIAKLVQASTMVSETGDYRVRAEKLTGDEMGVLVDRFNEMLSGIQSRERELKDALGQVEQERERFHFMAESMPQKIFTAKPDGDVDYYNRQWTEFTGLEMDQMMGWNWAEFVHPDDIERNIETWRHSLETGEPFLCEHRFRRADGQYRWHLSRARAMRDPNGGITMWIGSNTDIHEQKEKEEELRQANDDLQQFAYSASHDLQEPIRNVAVYSELIFKRYHDELDADGREFLGFLVEGARRLSTLVHDLLAYTSASKTELSETAVDAGAVLSQTVQILEQAIRENDASVTHDRLPELYMESAHLQQIFQNLIGNAIKYRRGEPPRVHVSATMQGGYWCFSVQDNGMGIEPQYKEKIFGLFKRLHRDPRYSGTGIGLAICQRVVERYGGRIWVESEFGRGSTFYFTVPKRTQSGRSAAFQSSPSRG
jgi:PAS domain S-box-containing protein